MISIEIFLVFLISTTVHTEIDNITWNNTITSSMTTQSTSGQWLPLLWIGITVCLFIVIAVSLTYVICRQIFKIKKRRLNVFTGLEESWISSDTFSSSNCDSSSSVSSNPSYMTSYGRKNDSDYLSHYHTSSELNRLSNFKSGTTTVNENDESQRYYELRLNQIYGNIINNYKKK